MLDRYLEQHGGRFVSELRELCAIPSEATDRARSMPRRGGAASA
jgi:hypothetical protein